MSVICNAASSPVYLHKCTPYSPFSSHCNADNWMLPPKQPAADKLVASHEIPISMLSRSREPLAHSHRSFLTGDFTHVPDSCIYHNKILVRFSYEYVLSLCLFNYISRKLFSMFEFPYLKARYILIISHRKEFRRKDVGRLIEFLNHFTSLTSTSFL